MKTPQLLWVCLSLYVKGLLAFGVVPPSRLEARRSKTLVSVHMSDDAESPKPEPIEEPKGEEKMQAVGNLVRDDEWEGLGMEMTEIIRMAVMEDVKKNAREFLGSDNYKIGDISKELDRRVKDSVAEMRGKDEYELFDLVMVADELSKNYTEELTGRPYVPGDLSIELDKRIKQAAADFCGKPSYEFGDITREIDRRVKTRVEEFTGKEYTFGDISRTIEDRRRQWVSDFLGEEAAKNYKFGDITKKAVLGFTGKDKYEFGDVTKKIIGDLFGGRKKKG